MIGIKTIKELFKQSIDESDNMNEALQRLFDKVYDKGKEDAEKESRPQGHWIIDERPESDRETICTNCDQPIFKYHKLDFDYRPPFCPNCGAKMGR